MNTYEVTHDKNDPNATQEIVAADEADAIRAWIDDDPHSDEFSDHFDVFSREKGEPEWTKHSVTLETVRVIRVDGQTP